MQRKSQQRLDAWLASPHRKPLVIRGARQVGKSTLVRLLAERAEKTLHQIDLERYPELDETFATLDSARILSELEHIADRGPLPGSDALLFLDEIQAAPSAIPALRALHEDHPELPILAAGSLLEFVLADHHFSMPVGRVEYLFLEPMGFEEFLAAVGENSLLELLRTWTWDAAFPSTAHERLLTRLRDYFVVGGMPEAVLRFAESASLAEASAVHAALLETYRDDFAKYGTRPEIERLRKIYDFIPGAVGEKFKYSHVDQSEASRELKRALELLVMARVVRRVIHTDATGIPLGATLKETTFKTYFLDVGLMNAACGLTHLPTERLTELRFVNEGAMAEQFIAEHLPLTLPDDRSHTLTYWLREGRANNAEVDFVQQYGDAIVPIEVKAGKSGTLKSLHELMRRRDLRQAVRFDTNAPIIEQVSHTPTRGEPGEKIEFELLSLPLYLVEELPRLLTEA